MRDGTTVLINDEYNRKSCIEQFPLTLGCRLLNSVKDLFKGDDRNHGCNDLLIVLSAKHRLGNRQCHLLTGANNLRTAHYNATAIHMGEYLTDAFVYLVQPYDVELKGTVGFATYRPQCQSDEIRIFLKSLLKSLVVTLIVKGLDSSRNLECPSQSGYDVAIPLTIQFNLASLVLN